MRKMFNVKKIKNQTNTFLYLIFREISSIVKQSYFYISGIFFVLFSGFSHFFLQNFFSMYSGSTSLASFFLGMPYISIIVIPTLVMNVWNSRNDIFDSFPISIAKTVLSKFFSILILYTLILLFTLPIVFCTNFFGNVSIPTVFTGYFVIFLYSACVIALSIFIFSFFQNKAVAFFTTAIILALLDTIHFLPLYFNLPSSIANLARNFSVSWHFDAASKGILDSRDCFFYIVLASLFCILTVFHIKSQKKGRFIKEVLFYPIIALLLLLNLNLYYGRIDLTQERQFTLSEESKETLRNLISPIEITYYLSEDFEKIYPQVRDVKDFLYQLSYENKFISVKVIDPQKKGIEASLENLGIISQQIQDTQDNKTSFSSVYSSILIETKGKYKVIPFVLSTSELEYNLLTRIKNLSSNFIMEVLILVGNGFSLEYEYGYVPAWFESAGFRVKEVKAEELETLQVAPNQCLVVLGSSKLTLNDAVSIETYLQNGGKALFAVNENSVDILNTWTTTNEKFDPIVDMLKTWGFSIGNQLIQDIANCRIKMYGVDANNQIDYNNSTYINYPFWVTILPQNVNSNSVITSSFTGLESYWASPITLNEDVGQGEYVPLVYTSQGSWLQAPYSIIESQAFITDPFSYANNLPNNQNYSQYMIAATFSGNLPAYYLTNGIENTKITVISDQYFPSVVIENTNSPNNLNFLVNNCIYLTGNENLISIKNKGYVDNSLYKIQDSLEFTKYKNISIVICLILMPIFITILYIIQLIFRKFKIKNEIKKLIDSNRE